jgi:hypothetical protein
LERLSFVHPKGRSKVSKIAHDRVVMLSERLNDHLARWLALLPSDGWKGTPRELAAALELVAGHGDHRFQNPGGMIALREPFIRSLGWGVSSGRSKTGRWIRFDRVGPPAAGGPTEPTP